MKYKERILESLYSRSDNVKVIIKNHRGISLPQLKENKLYWENELREIESAIERVKYGRLWAMVRKIMREGVK